MAGWCVCMCVMEWGGRCLAGFCLLEILLNEGLGHIAKNDPPAVRVSVRDVAHSLWHVEVDYFGLNWELSIKSRFPVKCIQGICRSLKV